MLIPKSLKRALTLLLPALLVACEYAPPPPVELNGASMGTHYQIKYVTTLDIEPAEVQAQINRLLDGINAVMSTYDPRSALSRFNDSADTGWQNAPYSLVSIIDEARSISELSDGAFDVTVGPLVDLWGFGPTGPVQAEPTPKTIARARARVGYTLLETRLSPPALRKHKSSVRVDLSAIAKGYAVDQVAALLERKGIDRYLVEIGGEIRAGSRSQRERPWRLGIEQPDEPTRKARKLLAITAGAVATSGDYRNFFTVNGKRYSHSIDPTTGRPVTHDLASVTVVADNCMRADGLATALLVLGPVKGRALAARLNIAAYFVERTANGFIDYETRNFTRINRASEE